MNEIRVLHVNKFYSPTIGGIEKITQLIAEGLRSKTNGKVICCQTKGSTTCEVINEVETLKAGSMGVFHSMPVSFSFCRLFSKAAKGCHIVQFHMPFPLGDLACFFSRYKGKVIIWWHSDIVRQKKLLFFYKPLLKWMLKRADSIIVATESHIHSSMFLPQYAAKCIVIPFGIDFTVYTQPYELDFLSKQLSNKRNKKLLFVGRLVYYKGIDVLIRAMETVTDAELFVVGDGPLEKDVKGNGIHHLGTLPHEKLLAAYADCDIFIFPSIANSEAFGLVQLEAMYYGKPVINTNLPTGVPFVSLHEKTGLTVKTGDVSELAGAISLLINDDDKRTKYGKNAAMRVREHFNIQQMFESLYKHYKDVLAG